MSQQSATQAMVLSSGYAIGLGYPFLAIGFGMEKAIRFRSVLEGINGDRDR
jgi:cytochrome c biogenesis protein CcdA